MQLSPATVRGFVCPTVRSVPKIPCQDYHPNVRSLQILIRIALILQCRICGELVD